MLGKVITLGVDGDPGYTSYKIIKPMQPCSKAEFHGGFALGLAILPDGKVNGYETKFSIVDGDNVLNIFPSEDNLATTPLLKTEM